MGWRGARHGRRTRRVGRGSAARRDTRSLAHCARERRFLRIMHSSAFFRFDQKFCLILGFSNSFVSTLFLADNNPLAKAPNFGHTTTPYGNVVIKNLYMRSSNAPQWITKIIFLLLC